MGFGYGEGYGVRIRALLSERVRHRLGRWVLGFGLTEIVWILGLEEFRNVALWHSPELCISLPPKYITNSYSK